MIKINRDMSNQVGRVVYNGTYKNHYPTQLQPPKGSGTNKQKKKKKRKKR